MPSDPLVLAFDTSAAHCAAALVCGERVLACRTEEMAKGQAERLMVLIFEVMEAAGATRGDIDRIGVGTGPGNFTGIRISVAAARGLALSLGVQAVGVSGLEALAEDSVGPVLACLPAPRDNVYIQGFGGAAQAGPAFHCLKDLPKVWAIPGLRCVGPGAPEVAAHLGVPVALPAHDLATGIARRAARCALTCTPRPVPLYLRAADAAPARDFGPMMLT